MSGIFFVLFIFIFLVLIEILTMMFKLTGLTDEKARFQVITIITGTGFTTKESELITQHKTRRRLAQNVMIIGYIGWATIISFMATIIRDVLMKAFSIYHAAIIITILGIIFYILRNHKVVIFFDNIVEKILIKRRVKQISRKNIYTLLNRKHGYGIYSILIDSDSFLIGKTILESKLKEKEIQVLNIDKGDEYIAFPSPDYVFEEKDNITIYGRVDSIIRMFHIR